MYQIGTTLMVGASPDLVELGKLLGRDGERVALMSRNESRLTSLKERLMNSGVRCEAFPVDVTDTDSVLLAFQRLAQWSRRLDRLIYNVGMVSHEAASALTTPALHKVMSTNFFGFVNCLQLAMPMFKRTGGGHAMTISSARALDDDQPVAFAASKASLRIYCAALRRELESGVFHVSEVFLGQMPDGKGWRDLTCEEIVQGLASVVALHPERYVIGDIPEESGSNEGWQQ